LQQLQAWRSAGGSTSSCFQALCTTSCARGATHIEVGGVKWRWNGDGGEEEEACRWAKRADVQRRWQCKAV